MKRGLIMEGGAMRGMFTNGVIDVMMEHHIVYDGAIGVSAGAAFGCNYKSHQIGRPIRYNKRFAHEKRYCSMYSWLKTGDLYGAEFCYHKLPNELDIMDKKTYDADPMEFYVVATDCETGKPKYKKLMTLSDTAYEWMRASASMPVVSRPVELEGRKYLDGGISDSIPVKYFESIGYDRNVIILTQPLDYVKKPQAGMKFIGMFLKNYPAVAKDLAERHDAYNKTLSYILAEEKAGRTFVIRPPYALKIGRTEHDPEVMEKVYQTGRKTMEEEIQDLTTFLRED